MKKWVLVFLYLGLTSCASTNFVKDSSEQRCHLASGKTVTCFDRPRVQEVTDKDGYNRAYSHEPWFNKYEPDNRPKIGIASGGGGTKASAFSMGVIKRLVQDDLIKEVDIISSVSGGGHPVAFLYGRARYAQLVDSIPGCNVSRDNVDQNQIDYQELKCMFTDLNHVKVHFPYAHLETYRLDANQQILTIPSNDLISAANNSINLPLKYIDALEARDYHLARMCLKSEDGTCNGNSPSAIPSWDAAVDWDWGSDQEPPFRCKDDYMPAISGQGSRNDDRHINAAHRSFTWHRCWQDMLSTWSSEVLKPSSKTYLHRAGAWSAGIGLTALSLPPHHLANTMFDWQWDISPLYRKQRDGNERMGMALPKHTPRDNWPEKYRSEIDIRKKCPEFEPEKINSEHLNFSDLRCAEKLKLPMWVINATTPTRSHFNLKRIDLTRMDDFRFEFTPYSFGSHRYGYVSNQDIDIFNEHNISLPKAVSSSYAFLDSRQRVVPGSKSPMSSLGYLGINGGIHLLNIDWGISISNYNMKKADRAAYNLLPAPLNYYSRLDERALRPHIPLADGGINRDGLGILPLLERQTENIIVLNQGASISDLCQFNAFLISEELHLVFEGDPRKISPRGDGDIELKNGPNEFCTKDYWDQNSKPELKTELNFQQWTRPVWKGQIEYIDKERSPVFPKTNIYFVTANVFLAPNANGLEPCMEAIIDSKNGDLEPLRKKSLEVQNISSSKPHHDYPPSLCAWMHRNLQDPDAAFPAHGMAGLTIDSSQRLSMAYIDLGWFLAGGLGDAFTEE